VRKVSDDADIRRLHRRVGRTYARLSFVATSLLPRIEKNTRNARRQDVATSARVRNPIGFERTATVSRTSRPQRAIRSPHVRSVVRIPYTRFPTASDPGTIGLHYGGTSITRTLASQIFDNSNFFPLPPPPTELSTGSTVFRMFLPTPAIRIETCVRTRETSTPVGTSIAVVVR
jgi:hypothetical protein